ncbi:hypothetical protein [Brevibacillus antibioticus]|nr:hypothetical protein [Brevibacillus antibioticus]
MSNLLFNSFELPIIIVVIVIAILIVPVDLLVQLNEGLYQFFVVAGRLLA